MAEHENKQLEELLENHDKGVSEATGILSRLFRKTLADLGVTPMVWNKLMNAYLDDPHNRVPRHSRGRSSTRGNLNKELRKPNMTWNNFIKGIYFLNPIEAEFSMKLSWRGGHSTIHRLIVTRGSQVDENEDSEDTDK